MDNKQRCQCCGMPISAEFGNLGTNADGTTTDEHCAFCFQTGAFTNPDQTLEEMLQSSVDNMTQDLQMPVEHATQLAQTFIPTLRRWQN